MTPSIGELTIGTEADLQVDLLPLGARITALRVPLPGGTRRNVVLGLGSREDYLACDDFLGATIGRVANDAGPGHWLDEVRQAGRRPPQHPARGARRLRPAGMEAGRRRPPARRARAGEPGRRPGLPGDAHRQGGVEVEGAELRTTYTATTDAPTVVNLTSHPYFDLEGPDGTVEGHRLEVAAQHYLPIDDTGLPAGEPEPVGCTDFDLTVPMPVAPGFDHTWLLDGEGLREVAVLEGGGLRLELATDQPTLHVYTGGGRWNGIALGAPARPRLAPPPDWPSIVLRPGEDYRWRSVVRIVPSR